MSVWNPENIKDVAESLGIINLSDETTRALTSDIEYRLAQVLEEALKFMRHGKRQRLTTQDISQALRVLGVEPLYGYETTQPLRFGEASIGPGQPLYYVEDEEVEFEKLINAPLPKVPREITFTAHWLAVEGVQPSIPQNPTSAEARTHEMLPRGGSGAGTTQSGSKAAAAKSGSVVAGGGVSIAATTAAAAGISAAGAIGTTVIASGSGQTNAALTPLVKHVLSLELQQYFEKVSTALLEPGNTDYRQAALSSVTHDPGLHQLLPYFVQFIAEKVTHDMHDLFVLQSMMELVHALLYNSSLFVDPYVSSLIPPILTCLLGRSLGHSTNTSKTATTSIETYALRQTSASLLQRISRRYGKSTHTLRPRLARTCLKAFLDPTKSLASHYGAILGLRAMGGKEVVRSLIVPNLKAFQSVVQDGLADETKKAEAELVIGVLLDGVRALSEPVGDKDKDTGAATDADAGLRIKLEDKIGGLFTERVCRIEGWTGLAKVLLEA